MAHNLTIFGDIADNFDALVAYDEKLLDNWVEGEGYSLTSMVAASTAKAFMTFAKGFVDVGRLGNGILIDGGWKGAGKDALRALNLAGGAGAIVSRGTKLLRATQVGNSCTWQAAANTLNLSGQRFFATAADLAGKAGVNFKAVQAAGSGTAEYAALATLMAKMNIPLRVLSSGTPQSLQSVLQMVKANPGGVVTFSIRFGATGQYGHRLYATWSRLHGFVIRDPNFLLKTYRSAGEVIKAFGQSLSPSASPVHFIPNSVLVQGAQIAEGVGGLAGLGLQLLPVVKVPAGDPETALQALMTRDVAADPSQPSAARKAFVAPATPGNGAANHSDEGNGRWHTVAQGEWLSKIAQSAYGNMHKWPVIYFHPPNRRVIGANPDHIKPGQKLFLPELPHASLITAATMFGTSRQMA